MLTMKNSVRTALLWCALLSFGALNLVAADTTTPVRVLFLGDRAGHRPAERFAILQPALTPRNIELTYTEAMTNLNSAYLGQFDALLIYANINRIAPEQETAMMEFVAAGGGLVPIHCASFCFHNSTNYIGLVGGQFQRHLTGVFKETIINADHPVMKGLTPIESWDETYVHTKHNTNRIVLAERRYPGTNAMTANLGNTTDTTGAEPYTWVREHGKGRMFYTAWGHDRRTWTNANFQALVENGIRWAAENSPNRSKRPSQ
jgi:type 1 glutamine amidotransferase